MWSQKKYHSLYYCFKLPSDRSKKKNEKKKKKERKKQGDIERHF